MNEWEFLLELELKLSRVFFSKFALDGQNKKNLISANTDFLTKFYSFLNEDSISTTNLSQIHDFTEKWWDLNKNKKFHKNDEMTRRFEVFRIFVELFDKEVQDVDFMKFFTFSFFLSLKKLSRRNLQYYFLNEVGLDHLYYSKSSLTDEWEENLSTFILILSNTYEIKIDFRGFDYIALNFLLNLEGSGILRVSSKTNSSKNKFNYLVKYDFLNENDKNSIDRTLNYLKIHNNISFEIPIIFNNSYLSSNSFKFGEIFMCGDNLHSITKVFKTNPRYGYMIEEKDYLTNADDNLGSLNTESSFKKTSIRQNLVKSPFLNLTLIKDTKTKIYLDHSKLKKVIDLYVLENLPNLNIDIDTKSDELLCNINVYSNIQANANKNLINSIIHFLYLQDFLKKTKNHEFFYALFFFDFRGRKNYDGLISLTSFKLLRFCVFGGYFEYYELMDIIEDTLLSYAYSLKSRFFYMIEEDVTIFHDSWFKMSPFAEISDKDFKNYNFDLIITCLIDIGTTFKNELLINKSYNDTKYAIIMDTFVKTGLEEFRKFNLNKNKYFLKMKTEDLLKLESSFIMLTGGINLFKKESISLDFSCSGNQIKYLLSRFKDEKNYELINLAGEDKYTCFYSYIITEFKKFVIDLFCDRLDFEFEKKENFRRSMHTFFNKIEDLEELLTIFKRTGLKKSIMTQSYSIKYPAFFEYFKVELKKVYGHQFIESNNDQLNALTTILYNFQEIWESMPGHEIYENFKFFVKEVEKKKIDR